MCVCVCVYVCVCIKYGDDNKACLPPKYTIYIYFFFCLPAKYLLRRCKNKEKKDEYKKEKTSYPFDDRLVPTPET